MKVEVHEQDGFRMVRTVEPIPEGGLVLDLSDGVVHPTPSRTSIRVGPDMHTEHPIGAFVNHSCEPTCVVFQRAIIALVELPPGTEITFDYTESEGPLASPFTCIKCGERVSGAPAPCKKPV